MLDTVLSAGGWLPYGQIVLILSTVGFGLCAIAFALLAPWYKSSTGTLFLSLMANFAVVLLVVSIGAEWGTVTFVRVARMTVLTGTAINAFWMLYTIVRAQVNGRKHSRINRIVFKKDQITQPTLDEPWDGVDRRVSDTELSSECDTDIKGEK